jgi:hypothetical protein
VPVEPVALAPIAGRRHIGLAVDDIADMAEQAGVEDGEHRRAVIGAALVEAAQLRALGRDETVHA